MSIERFEPLILIAEDDPDDALLLKDAFFDSNQQNIVFLSDGKLLIEYVKKIELELPQLIVVDLNMPVLDGKGVIKELRKNMRTAGIPIVVLSTTKSQDDIETVTKLGANAFFSKPSSYDDLVKITTAISKKWLTDKDV